MTPGEKITWTPEMSVGVPSLDDDHKVLVACLNDFVEACEEDEGLLVTDSIFSSLLEYTSYHFKREEAVMEVCGYADLEAHKALHQKLAEQVVDTRERITLSRDGAMNDEIRDFLLSWLQKHILGSDMDYVPACVGKEEKIAARLKDIDAELYPNA